LDAERAGERIGERFILLTMLTANLAPGNARRA
jgi:hypothetical protein